MLAKTLGVRTLIIAVNKLDDCDWDKGRYDEIVNSLTPYLKQVKICFNLTLFLFYINWIFMLI